MVDQRGHPVGDTVRKDETDLHDMHSVPDDIIIIVDDAVDRGALIEKRIADRALRRKADRRESFL